MLNMNLVTKLAYYVMILRKLKSQEKKKIELEMTSHIRREKSSYFVELCYETVSMNGN